LRYVVAPLLYEGFNLGRGEIAAKHRLNRCSSSLLISGVCGTLAQSVVFRYP
jgi:hypothetical protein